MSENEVKRLQRLKDKHTAINQKISKLQNAKRGKALLSVRQLVATQGFVLAEVFPLPAAKAYRKQVMPPKPKPVRVQFLDPVSGAIWGERGMPPKWIEGKDRKQFQC